MPPLPVGRHLDRERTRRRPREPQGRRPQRLGRGQGKRTCLRRQVLGQKIGDGTIEGVDGIVDGHLLLVLGGGDMDDVEIGARHSENLQSHFAGEPAADDGAELDRRRRRGCPARSPKSATMSALA